MLALLTALAAVAALLVAAGPMVDPAVGMVDRGDGDRRFWVNDKHHYKSPWYRGNHRRMINFGCTRAPYYSPSPRCQRQRGFHHGVDVAMKCGTPLFAGRQGRVVQPRSAGALGSANGAKAFRIRNAKLGRDMVIAHVRKVFVRPGDRVRKGQRIARASDAAAPDGCHLHFEVRPAAASYVRAVSPERLFHLRRAD